jgi:adenosylcobyric acid synthase
MTGRVVMVQGTSSSAGKSIMVTALCRILKQDGYSVAPFKSQNMSLNSFVTPEGGEIGRAQAVQAEAAGIPPSVHMNPVLLKPQGDSTSQVIVQGRVCRVSGASDYYKHNQDLLKPISESLARLRRRHEVVVIEGAGSPAEINLMEHEIANMRIAELAQAPVILVGDIDRGGVFASLTGTLQLLPPRHRKRVKGFVINKFRGDVSLLKPGLDYLENRCRRPVLGVIPYIRDVSIAQEDSVYLDERYYQAQAGKPDICIIKLPRISNFDDFDPLEPACNVRYITSAEQLGNPDLIILPGTKNTIGDLDFLRRRGIDKALVEKAHSGVPVIGICGGYQMMGRRLLDPSQVESEKTSANGLGLLDVDTEFACEKVTAQVKARVHAATGLFKGMQEIEVAGYEIHMGRSLRQAEQAAFDVMSSNGRRCHYADGAADAGGNIFGTYIHGLFNNAPFTRQFLHNLNASPTLRGTTYQPLDREKAYDRLAEVFRHSLDMQAVNNIIFGGAHGRKI